MSSPKRIAVASPGGRATSVILRRMTEVSSPPEYARTMRLGLDIVDRASQQRQDDRLLGVEPVLRLVERDRARAVEHRIGDLLAPVGGQAVHDQHRRLRAAYARL